MYFTGSSTFHLTNVAIQRLETALSDSTNRAYTRMFRTFIAYLEFHGLLLSQVNSILFLGYLEFLLQNDVSPPHLANHVSAIKTKFTLAGASTNFLQDPRIGYFLKSAQKNGAFRIIQHAIVDVPTLKKIVTASERTYMGHIFKAVYLTAFFSFMRLSNLCPHSLTTFDPLKHLTREDVIVNGRKMLLVLKWSKTLQLRNKVKFIHIPYLGNDICPMLAILTILQATPSGKNLPLFQVKSGNVWIPLTDSKVRTHLKTILSGLSLTGANITFHSFRRSGATFAFNHHVPIQQIQNHGTWTSDCVWRYIVDSADAGSQVADAFAFLAGDLGLWMKKVSIHFLKKITLTFTGQMAMI